MKETEAMQKIEEVLEAVELADARDRVLTWAWSKYHSQRGSIPLGTSQARMSARRTARTASGNSKAKAKRAHVPTFNKQLNLKPDDKPHIDAFAGERKPKSNAEKCVVAVYYLSRVLEKTPADTDSVYSCFKVMGWKPPADLANALQWTASQRGWLDTSDMAGIEVTPLGEYFVEQELAGRVKSET